jgi:hypothetical protein
MTLFCGLGVVSSWRVLLADLVAFSHLQFSQIAADLRRRGAVVDTVVVDLAVVEARQAFAEMIRRLCSVDVVLVTYGLSLVTKKCRIGSG